MSFSNKKRSGSFLSASQPSSGNTKPPSRRSSGINFPTTSGTTTVQKAPPTKTIIVDAEDEEEDFFTNLENQSFHDLNAVKKQIQAREQEVALKRQQSSLPQESSNSAAAAAIISSSSQKSSRLGSRKNSGTLLATTIVDAEEVNYRKKSLPRRDPSGDDDENEIDNSAIIMEMNDEQDRMMLLPARQAPQIPPPGSFSAGRAATQQKLFPATTLASPPAKQLSQLELLSLNYKRNLFDLKAASSQSQFYDRDDQSNGFSGGGEKKSFDQSVVEALSIMDSCFREMLQRDERKFAQLGLEQLDDEHQVEMMFEKERNHAFEKELRSMMFRFA